MARDRRGGMLSIVERGWRGARYCSLDAAGRGICVRHLIKGRLTREVRAMIRPVPDITVRDVTRWHFHFSVWRELVQGTLLGRWRWVLVDHERTQRIIGGWCRRFGITVVVIQDTLEGYNLLVDRRIVPLQTLIGIGEPALVRHAGCRGQ